MKVDKRMTKKIAVPIVMVGCIFVGFSTFGHAISLKSETKNLINQTEILKNNAEKPTHHNTKKEKTIVKKVPSELKNAEKLTEKIVDIQTEMTRLLWANSQYNENVKNTTKYKQLIEQMKSLLIPKINTRILNESWYSEPSWTMKILKMTKVNDSKVSLALAYYTKENELAQFTTLDYIIDKKRFKNVITYQTLIGQNVTTDNSFRNYDRHVESKGE